MALPMILIGLLRLRSPDVTEKAVSWYGCQRALCIKAALTVDRSVIGRFLHSSYWPTILGTDSAATFSANRATVFMACFRLFMVALIAVAAIVTPFGLYESIETSPDSTTSTFHHIQDLSTFGLGTPPRSSSSGTWSRICGYRLPYACPNSPNKLSDIANATGSFIQADTWYDSKIPQAVLNAFESGLVGLEPSVSGPFNIEYRSYVKSQLDIDGKGIPIDNGTVPYTKGAYQPLSTRILDDDISVVEGLVVDMKTGGIGFRNHSAPTRQPFGSTWTEDLLFISPETVCVDTNLTLDFSISATNAEFLAAGTGVFNLSLTDHGGFVNLNHTYPEWKKGDTQQNPELWLRAYKAAWLNNALSMAFMNVTNFANESSGIRAFSYLNSTLNKNFPLHYPNGETISSRLNIQPGALQITNMFGEYLEGTDRGQLNISTIGNQTTEYNFPSKPPIYSNPFHLTTGGGLTNNFSAAGK
jgi:hypothetical protein